tara:strand:+ start:108 stop:824 length:717 start_codon:yes stop_codon:yes gene_type:complete
MDSNNKIKNINEIINNKSQIEDLDFWINDPHIIFNNKYIFEIYPKNDMTRTQKFNAISRLIIFLTIFIIFISRDVKILIVSFITLLSLVIVYYFLNRKDSIKEGYTSNEMYQQFKDNFTNPDDNNPMMNVMLPEIQDNPHRNQAAPSYNKNVEEQIYESTKNIVKKNFNDDKIDERLFNDLGDKIQFENSMRQFFTNPNTTIPNNQKEFANFCYGNTALCKDGNLEDCFKNLNEYHRL